MIWVETTFFFIQTTTSYIGEILDGFNIYFRTQNLKDETNDVLHLL